MSSFNLTNVLMQGGNMGTNKYKGKYHMKTQEDSPLQAKERSLRRNQISLDLRLTSLQNCEKINFCCLNHSVSGILLW